jgi:cytochrome c556
MDDLRDQIFGKVTGDLDIFKKLGSKIPGFSGYIERQARRDSDKLLRDMIFKRFRELEGRVSSLQKDFISHGEIKYVDDLEAVAIKLRTFADKVRTAPRGYSGLFDAVNKNEAELQTLYEFDAAMLELADEVDRAIDNVETSVGTDGLPASIRHLETSARLCVDTYNQRENVFIATFATEEVGTDITEDVEGEE